MILVLFVSLIATTCQSVIWSNFGDSLDEMEWSEKELYELGDVVQYNGILWEAKYISHGFPPSDWLWKEVGRAQKCPTGWHDYDDNCYLYDPDTRDYISALFLCDSYGHIVSIHSEAESAFLSSIADTSFWIGIHGTFSSKAEFTSAVPLWTDDTAMNFQNWNTDEPNSASEQCVESDTNGKWNDVSCTSERATVCKIPGDVLYTPEQREKYFGKSDSAGEEKAVAKSAKENERLRKMNKELLKALKELGA